MIPKLRNISYEMRLKECGLTALETRRLRGDQSQVCSVWFNFTSMHSLCCVTVCKMIAITKPLRYNQLLTSNRCYLIITCIWLSGAILTTLGTRFITRLNFDTCTYDVPHTEDIKLYLLLGVVTGLLLPVSVFVYATTKIVCVIVRTHRQIAAQVNSMSGPVGITPSLTLAEVYPFRQKCVIYMLGTCDSDVSVSCVYCCRCPHVESAFTILV